MILVTGMPGVGKTALAVRAARRSRTHFDGPRIHVLVGAFGPALLPDSEVQARVLAGLGVTGGKVPQQPTARTDLIRTKSAGQAVLLVLDDVATEDVVEAVMPTGERCATIVSSRHRLATLDTSKRLPPLDRLDRISSIEVLTAIAERSVDGADGEHVATIARLCGDLPLALRIMGGLLSLRRAWTWETAASQLADEHHRLEMLKVGNLDVRASFELSYRQLTDQQANMFRRLALVDAAAIPFEVAATLAGVDQAEAEATLTDLLQANLVHEPSERYFSLHDLLRVYARSVAETTEPADLRRRLLGAALDVYVTRAYEHGHWLDPSSFDSVAEALDLDGHTLPEQVPAATATDAPLGRAPHDALDTSTPADLAGSTTQAMEAATRVGDTLVWFEAEHASLGSLVAQAAEAGHGRAAIALAGLCRPYLKARGHLREAVVVTEIAHAAAATLGPGERIVAGVALGRSLEATGDYPRAIDVLTDTVRIATTAGARADAARACAAAGRSAARLHRFDDADTALQQAVRIFLDLKMPVEAAGALSDHGATLRERRRFAEATERITTAINVASQAPADLQTLGTLAWAHENLGAVRKWQGSFIEAARQHQQSFQLFARIGDPAGEALALRNVGDLFFALGRHRDARRCYTLSEQRSTRAGNTDGIAQAATSLAMAEARRFALIPASRALRHAAHIIGYRAALTAVATRWAALLLLGTRQISDRLHQAPDLHGPATRSTPTPPDSPNNPDE